MKRKYKCSGCGEGRHCLLETNEEIDSSKNLKCVLDETNQTSYNWKEILSEDKKVNTKLTLNYCKGYYRARGKCKKWGGDCTKSNCDYWIN